jgi:hypothetical protein
MTPSISLAVLADDRTVPRWAAEAVSEATAQTNATVDLVVKIVAMEPIDIADAKTWWDVESRLFETSTGMLADSIDRLERGEFDPEPPEQLGELTTTSGAAASMRYYLRTLRGFIGRT